MQQTARQYSFSLPPRGSFVALGLIIDYTARSAPYGELKHLHILAKWYQLMHIIPWEDSVAELAKVMLALSAMRPDNTLRQRGALNFHIPVETYGHAKTGHHAIQHHGVDAVIQVKTGG